MILTIVSAVVGFYAIAIWWFLRRMGDKFGTDKRWWVRALDFVLISPLIPIAYLLGKLINKEIR